MYGKERLSVRLPCYDRFLLHIPPPCPVRASVSCATTFGQETAPMRSRCAILCIDDQELELSIRKMVLEKAGYAVFTAANTVQGAEIFNAHRIDLVMTDHPEGVTGI